MFFVDKGYGIPQALYCSRKNAFVLTREPTDAELLKGIPKAKSRFERTCEKLGVEVIPANSPQAKGRVEEIYLPSINRKFFRPAACADDARVPPGKTNMEDIRLV
jgi:hypothetical protein